MVRNILWAVLLAFMLTDADAKVSRQTADSIAGLLNQRGVECNKSCPLFDSENSNAALVNTLFIDVLALLGTVWLYTNYKKKYIIAIGAAVVLAVTGSLFLSKSGETRCVEYSDSQCDFFSKKTTKAQSGGLSDFEPLDSSSASASTAAVKIPKE